MCWLKRSVKGLSEISSVPSLFSLTASLVQIWSASQKPASEPANCLLLSTSPWKTWTSGSSPLTEAVSEDTSILEGMCCGTWHEMKIHPIVFLNACYRSYCEQLIYAYVSFKKKRILTFVSQNTITGSSSEVTDSLMTFAGKLQSFMGLLRHCFELKRETYVFWPFTTLRKD